MASTRQARDWALGKGWDVPPVGQLARPIIEAFNAAHPDDPAPFGKGKPPRLVPVPGMDRTPAERTAHARQAAAARWGTGDA